MKFCHLVIVLGILFSESTAAQLDGVTYNWNSAKDAKKIQIYTSAVAGSPFKAVRGVMTVNASVSSLVALVEDMPACSDWAEFCRESRVEKRVSASESYVYVYNDIPFPVSDRDVYAHVVWSKDPMTKRISMTSTAAPDGTPNSRAVRIEKALSQWHFTPNEDGTSLVESFAHIDPNGPTPAWVTNLMLVNSPHKTMFRMRELVESGAYKEVEVPFVDEL